MADISSLINPVDENDSLNESDTLLPLAPKLEPDTSFEKEETAADEADSAADDDDDGNAEDGAIPQETIEESFEKIKTHFPAARIKKIMQSDEDIGKVAQATPVIVGRALEIFMANLVEAAAVEARQAGVRRIAACHIRAAVENTEQFDFLVDVVSKYLSTK